MQRRRQMAISDDRLIGKRPRRGKHPWSLAPQRGAVRNLATYPLMTHHEIQAAYEAGPDAVKALVERLLATISQQQATIDALTARVKQLETVTPTRPLVFVPGLLCSQLWDRVTGTRIWPP